MWANYGIGKSWYWQTMVLANHGIGKPWYWQIMVLANHGIGKSWYWQTMVLANHGIGKSWYWQSWYWQTMVLANHGIGKSWYWQIWQVSIDQRQLRMLNGEFLFYHHLGLHSPSHSPIWGRGRVGVVRNEDNYSVFLPQDAAKRRMFDKPWSCPMVYDWSRHSADWQPKSADP